MKTIIWKTTLLSLLMGGLASCDVLDVEPLDSCTESTVFENSGMIEAYVTKNYTLPRNGWGQAALRFVCDESMNNFSWWSSWNINKGEMTPDQLGGLNIWNDYYSYIKNCNKFFETANMDVVDEPLRTLLIGEMTFFRAYYYMELVNRFGGVPLVTKTFELDDTDMMLPRNSYEECVDFILKEFQKAADMLPERHYNADFGRVTKGAALAMKCRMELYAASPLWNTSDDKTRWEAAAATAEQVMALGYYLDPDYKGLFLNPKSPEIIYERLYTNEFGHWFDWENTPNGWSGYSATCVLQEMVDSYEMEDGTMPDPSKYATATSDPWLGRDPRFYASVVCDGQAFRNGTVDAWINEDGQTGGSDSEYGTDSWNYSKTHYFIRKFMNESLLNIWSDKGSQPWIYCRLAEIYLNYAEAKFHCGDEETARKYVNLVRERARNGNPDILPDVTESGEALLKRIQHERKIELAFEEHRFFDVRRWKIAEETENGKVHGIQIIRKQDGTKRYELYEVQERKFVAPNHYLLPIPSGERRKNDLLEQNPGYSK